MKEKIYLEISNLKSTKVQVSFANKRKALTLRTRDKDKLKKELQCFLTERVENT